MVDKKFGNIGGENLAKLDALKRMLKKEHGETRLARTAASLDNNFEGILLNDQRYTELADILRRNLKIGKGTQDPDYYTRCAKEALDKGLIEEELI